MVTLSRILIATDLSARSDGALERAIALAREHRAKLSVTHIVDENLPAKIADRLRDSAEQVIQETLASIPTSAEIDFTVSVTFGRAYESILRASENTDAELIVLGVHREDAFKYLFRGTTAERVIRIGDRLVLVVTERVKGKYRRVLIGVDFSVYSRHAIEFAPKFVPGGEFHLVHAYHVPFNGFLYGGDTQVSKKHEEQMKQIVAEEFSAFLPTADTKIPRPNLIMQEGVVQLVLREAVDQVAPDLPVVGTHGRTGVAHALLGSVAEDVLLNPPCDVLAIKTW